MAYGCGGCIPCRTLKRREWAHRIVLEANCHEKNAFLTLTYDEENLPEDMSLDPKVLQLFMKKLRKWQEPNRIRFYGVGEYGEEKGRPHYHVAVFGMSGCDRINTTLKLRGERLRTDCCAQCNSVRDLWEKGNIFLGTLEPRSAAYIAGYVNKKLGCGDLDERRHPPFARMSNRPGIGCYFMDEVASTLMEHGLEGTMADVPYGLRTSGRIWPLGSYLRRNLRRRIGRDEKAPLESYARQEERMRPLREYAKKITPRYQYENTLRGVVQDVGLGRRLQMEAKDKRRLRRRVI